MKKIGETHARVTLMRHADESQELDPAIAAVLDVYDPEWRNDPLDSLWMQAFVDYSTWVADHGRAPADADEGAAGLAPWIRRQASQTLSKRQERLLETLPGWLPTIADADAAPYWDVVADLALHGVTTSRAADQRGLTESVAAYIEVAGNRPTRSWGLDVDWGQRQFLTYALFCARHKRQPEFTEPSGRWIRQQRTAASIAPQLAFALNLIPDWEGLEGADSVFLARFARYSKSLADFGSHPLRNSRIVEHRASAAWAARQRAKRRRGVLPAEALRLLDSVGV